MRGIEGSTIVTIAIAVFLISGTFSQVSYSEDNIIIIPEIKPGSNQIDNSANIYWIEDWEGRTPGEVIFPIGMGDPLPWFYDLPIGSLTAVTPPPGSPPMQLLSSMDTGNVSALLNTPAGGYFGMGEIAGSSATHAFLGNWIYLTNTNRFDLVARADFNVIIDIAITNPGTGYQIYHWPGGAGTATGITVSLNTWHELFVEYDKVTDQYSIWFDGTEYEKQSSFITPTNNYFVLSWHGASGFNGYLDNLIHFSPPSHFPHLPIRINSNADFDEAHGVVNWATGDGSPGNPWIIEGWDINGTGYGYCLYIGNTTDYFVVRDCYLHGASGVTMGPYFTNSGLMFRNGQSGMIANNNVSFNSKWGIYLRSSNNSTINCNHAFSNEMGIFLSTAKNNELTENIVIDNLEGIYLLSNSNNNNVTGNNIESNGYGIYSDNSDGNILKENIIISNDIGLEIGEFSDNNLIYHNNIINSTFAFGQAHDFEANFWDNGYPSGGNYWSDYNDVDLLSGPNQDQPGSDGIGDLSYNFTNNKDNYPLMSPFEYTEYNIPLQQGWNLISLPVRQLNWSIDSVLESIAGKWDCIQTYDSVTSTWKSNNIYRPDSLNDLHDMNHLKAYWINITESGVILTVKGDRFNSTLSIPLFAGWNLVGYPTMNTETIANALWGTGADRVEVFDPGEPYRIKEVGPTYLMKPGEGYWVHVPADTVWIIDW